jgi:hypothetical protein
VVTACRDGRKILLSDGQSKVCPSPFSRVIGMGSPYRLPAAVPAATSQNHEFPPNSIRFGQNSGNLETGELCNPQRPFISLKVKFMNLLGRVLGGILIFISLAWLASIAQVFPFSRGTNQFFGQTTATPTTPNPAAANNAKNNQRTATNTLTAPRSPNTVIAQTNTTGTSPAGTAPAGTAPAGTTTTPGATAPTTPAPAQPVAAGW